MLHMHLSLFFSNSLSVAFKILDIYHEYVAMRISEFSSVACVLGCCAEADAGGGW